MSARSWRLPGPGAGVPVDVVVALGICIALELELRDQHAHRWITVAAAVLVAAPIAVRRRWPSGALIASCAVALGQAPLGGNLTAANGLILPPILLAYAAGAWLDLRRSVIALLAALGLFGALVMYQERPESASAAAGAVAFAGLLCAAPWVVGRVAHTPSRRADAFRLLARQTAAEVQAREQAAIAEERMRIGSELQDIIAHSVSAMVVQAGGARQLLRSDPTRARDSILRIERTGRETLADMRRLLGVLRRDDLPGGLGR